MNSSGFLLIIFDLRFNEVWFFTCWLGHQNERMKYNLCNSNILESINVSNFQATDIYVLFSELFIKLIPLYLIGKIL